MRIGLQLFTLRDFTKTAKDFAATLRRVHEIGYEGVQLSVVGCMNGDSPEVDASEARRMLDDLGLVCCATHRPWERFVEDVEAELEFHRILGCNYAAIGTAPAWAYEQGLDGFEKLAGEMGPMCDKLAGAGIRFGYHNHAIEFERLAPNAARPFDVLANHAPKTLCFELDTYWVVHAGVDLVPLIERLPQRLPVVHLKDKAVFGGEVDYAPVGEGNLDWGAILPAFKSTGTEWLVVEQDTCRRDPFDCIRSSFDFLTGADP